MGMVARLRPVQLPRSTITAEFSKLSLGKSRLHRAQLRHGESALSPGKASAMDRFDIVTIIDRPIPEVFAALHDFAYVPAGTLR
jgi:hypothetical protein